MPSKAKAALAKKHLTLAKADIAAGTASFRSAANHLAAAIKTGATQTEAAALVDKSQSWVNRLLKWRENGFRADSPFADDHARAIISGANNSAEQDRAGKTQYLTVQVVHRKEQIVAPYFVHAPKAEDEAPAVTRQPEPLGEVTRGDDVGEVWRGVGPAPSACLDALERAAADFAMSMRQAYNVGADVERRVRAVADRLLTLVEPPEEAVTLDGPRDGVRH
jgi:hypothetical protein